MFTFALGRSALLWTFVLAAGHGADFQYDLVIRSGRVVDGTGNPWFHGDVAVKAGRIAAVGRVPERGAKEIEAREWIIAPGFIDIHSHSDWTLLQDGRAESKIRQGVTTEVIGEGSSVAPFEGKLEPREVNAGGETRRIRSFSDYFAAVEKARIAVNVLSYVSLGNVWESVMGKSFERPTESQLQEMRALVKRSMEEGAFGFSTALMMPPNSLATTEDLVQFCKVIQPFGGIYSTHIHDEGLGVFDSVKQAIEIGERAGVPVDVIHLKIAEQKYWGRMSEVVDLIEKARQRGVNVQANVYPYTRGNNNLSSIIPPWAHEGGREQMLPRLRDQPTRERVKRDIRAGLPDWYNHYTAVGGDWSRMLVSANNRYKGMTMDRVIAMRTEGVNPPPDALDVMIDFLIENGGSVSTVYAHHTEEDMNLALRQPWCSVGSDGSALATEGPLRQGHPHPRNFGTFPRVLGVYVRERKLLTLEDAVRKMTSLNAAKLGLEDRGLLRAGLAADITVFDPARISDKSTYEEPFQYNEGIEHVIVNGEIVFESGKQTGARPGRALRKMAHAGRRTEKRIPVRLEVQNAGEGPTWNAATKTLYFTGGNRITRFKPDGSSDIFREPARGANGLLFDREGRLVVCESEARRVTRTESDGRITVLADRYQGMKFNTPNDLTMDSKGRIYFSDPRYGPRETMEMKDADGELIEGVYRIDGPGRVVRIIAHEVERPNGVLVTPGDVHLFVADNNNNTVGGARKLWRFDLRTNGTIDPRSRKLIFDWKTSRGPDGVKIDKRNRLFVAAGLNKENPPFETAEPYKGGIYVLSLEGRLLEFIPVPDDEVTNCAFGGENLETLFITAGGTLWKIPVD
jgi:N-acyl-D-amino-acid deacylase